MKQLELKQKQPTDASPSAGKRAQRMVQLALLQSGSQYFAKF